MTVFVQWHGGPNYIAGLLSDDLEMFPSIKEAQEQLLTRHYWGTGRFHYVARGVETSFTPGVQDSVMWIYKADPRGDSDPYPDMIMSVGPRGGVRKTRV